MAIVTYSCNDTALIYNSEKDTLLCVRNSDGKKLWVKKFTEPLTIQNVLFDDCFYYIACQTGETEGMFLTVSRNNGSTKWFIPGRTFLEVLYNGFLYLIFVDGDYKYFLIKVEREEGTKLWYHQISDDLYYYHFKQEGILLYYASGKKEMITYEGKRIVY